MTAGEQKPGDPADKAADGAFGGVHSHRAGYGDDKLARLIDWVRERPSATLASGEGALLLAEIDRLRDDVQKQADWADWAKGAIEWLEVAHMFGESLTPVGPDGYYAFSPDQWLKWAKDQICADEIVRLRDENTALSAEIDRLRARCRQIDDEAYDYAEQIEQLKAAAKDSADHYADARAEIDRLRERLTAVEAERDGAYGERNRVVAWAARMALALGFDVTVTKTEIQGWDAAWHNCIYVQSPEGQVSWHFHDREVEVFADLPRGAVAWDGHSTSQKYDRVRTARYTNRAERILAALREPSDGVVDAVADLGDSFEHLSRFDVQTAIRAAVAAAEQEVGNV